jgi:hypothetical protein
MRTFALAVLVIASLYEIVVQTFGLVWVGDSLSGCARSFAVIPIVAMIVGNICVMLPRKIARLTILASGLVITFGGLAIGGIADTQSSILCGTPIQLSYSSMFFGIAGVLFLWIGMRLTTGVRDGVESQNIRP